MKPASIDIRSGEVRGRSATEVAELVADRYDSAKGFLDSYNRATWITNFVFAVDKKKAEMTAEWRTSWKKLASGKRLIDELYSVYEINLRKSEFKKEIMHEMTARKTEDWRVLDQVLRSELNSLRVTPAASP